MRPINPQRPQSERKTAAQMSMEFATSAMTDRFRLLAPFVIHEGPAHNGDRESYTPAANAVLRDAADLVAAFR